MSHSADEAESALPEAVADSGGFAPAVRWATTAYFLFGSRRTERSSSKSRSPASKNLTVPVQVQKPRLSGGLPLESTLHSIARRVEEVPAGWGAALALSRIWVTV